MNTRTIFRRISLYAVVALFVVAGLPLQNNAQAKDAITDCDQAFYSSNDVLFYNPCATSCDASSATTGVTTVSKLRGGNNGEKIFNFWIDAGLTSQQAAGITGSMQHEGGFSPFRQEDGKSWPNWGWGIAQFTGQPAPNHPDTGGQRASAKAYVSDAVGKDLFDQYYQAKYGGRVSESNGFVPSGVPIPVNDKFLLGQLNYLLGYIKGFKPSSIPDRVNGIKTDFGQEVPANATLFEYIHSIVQAPDAAVAWTYLYEWPGNRVATSNVRAESATDILDLYSKGVSTACGGSLSAGGMTLDEAKKFIEESYKANVEDSRKYLGGAGQGCLGGPLANCVSFSVWFINKYTTLEGFTSGAPGNGGQVVGNVIARNPNIENGHSPRPYAIFSTYEAGGSYGHTGIIFGVDTEKGVVIVGEAACSTADSSRPIKGMNWITAREYPLSEWDSDAYTYAYADSYLKEPL